MRLYWYYTIAALLLFIYAGRLSILNAQGVGLESYGIEEGLSQGFISSILQDREGFIWVGTKNGLNRFDGKRFLTFSSSATTPFPITSEYITSLYEYGDFLILGTYGDGIIIFHKQTQRFTPIPLEALQISASRSPSIRRIAVDSYGNIWYLDWKKFISGNLYRIKLSDQFWRNLSNGSPLFAKLEIEQMYENIFNDFYMCPSGNKLFFGEKKNIGVYDTKTAHLELYVQEKRVHFDGFCKDITGNIWVSSDDGLQVFTGNKWKKFNSSTQLKKLVTIDKEHNFYIETEERELIKARVDMSKSRLNILKNYGPVPFLNVGLVDQSGNLWIGSGGKGLFKYNISNYFFTTLFKNASITGPPIHIQHSNEILSVSARNRFYISSGQSKTLDDLRRLQFKNGREFFTRHIFVKEFGDCFLYFKQNPEEYELACIDFLKNKKQLFPLGIDRDYAGNICRGPKDIVYLAINGILSKLHLHTGKLQKWEYDTILSYSHEVRALQLMEENELYIGTDAGLIKVILNGKAPIFKQIGGGHDPNFTWVNQDISCLAKDPTESSTLWIGTKGAGIYKWNTVTNQISNINRQSGLANDVVYGMLFDQKNNLWLSSNRGITQYKPQAPELSKSYTTNDGLQDLEFNTWAYGKSEDGLFLFGGVNGLNAFNPNDIRENENLPGVFISKLMVNNAEIRAGDASNILEKAIEFTSEINLKHNQNNLQFALSALEFTRPAKNRFKFYLEGAEDPWIHEQESPEVQYLNLAPGKYKFKVRASNNEGLFSPEIASISILIEPPFYKTTSAYLFYLVLFASLVYGFVQFQLRQIKLQNQVMLEQQEIDRMKDLSQFKNRLYTNITHEFRTPISIIQGASAQILDEVQQLEHAKDSASFQKKWKNNLNLIHKNGKQLLELVNQILHLSKLDDKKIVLNPGMGDVVAFVREEAGKFIQIAQEKDIEWKVSSSNSEFHASLDFEKLRLIINNLLSNAIKFCPIGAQVKVGIRIERDSDLQARLYLTVSDNGPGIAKEEQSLIFDRFYQGKHEINQASGTGIGLALCTELATVMNGSLHVRSIPNVDTTFTLVLPVEQVNAVRSPETSSLKITQKEQVAPTYFEYTSQKGASTDTILVVDDNADIRQFLHSCLEGMFNIQLAADGEAGLNLAYQTSPDIILTDLMMPGIDGVALVKSLKSNISTSHIPIVMLTAKSDLNTKLSSIETGIEAFLSKPFQPKELLLTLKSILDNRKAVQEYYRTQLLATPSTEMVTPPLRKAPTENAFISELQKILETNYKNAEFNVEQLCNELNMSRTNLHRKLKALADLSTTAFINLFRLQKAEILLKNSELNISEIAFECGFNDPKYFSRLFSDNFKCSPSEYRQTS